MSIRAWKIGVLLVWSLLSPAGVGHVGTARAAGPPAVAATADGSPAASAAAETTPVRSDGDAADDVAMWVHPTDPALSLVIGTDKRAALEVYDLSGRRIQRVSGDLVANNVDLRSGFTLGGLTVPLVATAGGGTRFFRLDPAGRQLVDVTFNRLREPAAERGICLYNSLISGRFYAFITSPDGWVEQWELSDESGMVKATLIRTWRIGSRLESCVADDEFGRLYVSEERVGIWEYGAEPDAPLFPRILVDATGSSGHLASDVEGLAIIDQPGLGDYLLASSQGDNTFVIYDRDPEHRFRAKFRVATDGVVDGCSDTDGIEATTAYLGPTFPAGILICQDGLNTTPGPSGQQNFKYVPLESVLAIVGQETS